MLNRILAFIILGISLCCIGFHAPAETQTMEPLAIVSPQDASLMETLAAREIHRYLYLRMGTLVPVVTFRPFDADAVIVARNDRPIIQTVVTNPTVYSVITGLKPQQYVLKTVQAGKQKFLVITGGDDAGTLYGAYRFAEHIGIRFYMHGDVIPDGRIHFELPMLYELSKPLFDLRGIQPFHDFPEGPDWWNLDEYKAILSQLPKLGMNFFGLHTYPEEHPNAEPTTWIGLPQDIIDDGQVKFSYPSSYMNTQRGNWGYTVKKTSDFYFGSAGLFERDDYGPDVMGGSFPQPETVEACNDVFNRTGLQLREAFQFARSLGIKTCIGTETPLTIPKRLREHLQEMGKDPSDPAVVLELYEGMFSRIMKTHPLDYYWFWTPEGWTWRGTKPEQVNATGNDLLTAITAADNVNASFTLGTCGWVLGPEIDRALFDRLLPKEMFMSCINRQVGKAPVETGFADVKDRPQWAIPWLEDDPALSSTQMWVGRMRADAVDALKYGCTGLMGIHWRTRILGPNVSSLAKAAWRQGEWAQSRIAAKKPVKTEGPVGGRYAAFPDSSITDTIEKELYHTVRLNLSSYHFSVPNGTYIVTLKFCEPVFNEKDMRSFNVNIQGKPVLENLDIFDLTGGNTAADLTFSSINVSEGWLDIDFIPVKDQPCISAISILSSAYTKHINCGGPAYKNYMADWPEAVTKPRDLPTGDFYLDWALHLFGPEAAGEIAAIFQQIDLKIPCPSDWVSGPGGIRPDDRPWEEVIDEYDFVDRLAKLRSRVKGKGSRERFDYWLNNFRFMKANARVNCLWAEYNRAMEQVEEADDNNTKKKLANKKAMPLRKKLVKAVGDVYKYLLLTVSNTGEMGTVANWEQHILPSLIEEPGKKLEEILGEELPVSAMLSKAYDGPPRVIVPAARTAVYEGETLSLRVIVLDSKAPREANLYWRVMGKGEFTPVPLVHVARGVYTVQFPPQAADCNCIEYYLKVRPDRGGAVFYPATAPRLNHTVVVFPKTD